MESIRVVLVSDHALTAMAVRSLIESASDLELVADTSWDESQRLVRSVRPDVVVIDVSTTDADVAVLVEQLQSSDQGSAVVVLSAAPHPAVTDGVSTRQAVAWVRKNGNADGVLTAIRSLAAGPLSRVTPAADSAPTIVPDRTSRIPTLDLVSPPGSPQW